MFGVRTKAAITATKARDTKLGGNRGVKPTVNMRKQSAAARQRASARAADIAPTITELQADGATSLRQIAAGLNAKDIPIPTARGEGAWTAPQVKRVVTRLVRSPAFVPGSELGPGVNPRHRRSAGPLYSFPLGRRKGRPPKKNFGQSQV